MNFVSSFTNPLWLLSHFVRWYEYNHATVVLQKLSGDGGYVVYTRRWLVLAMFVLYSASNAFQWTQLVTSIPQHRPCHHGHHCDVRWSSPPSWRSTTASPPWPSTGPAWSTWFSTSHWYSRPPGYSIRRCELRGFLKNPNLTKLVSRRM